MYISTINVSVSSSYCYAESILPPVPYDLLRFDCIGDVVWWVSVWKIGGGDMSEMKRERRSPCYFVMHPPDVVLLCLRFDSKGDLVWWVSVWKSGDGDMSEMKRERGSPCYFVIFYWQRQWFYLLSLFNVIHMSVNDVQRPLYDLFCHWLTRRLDRRGWTKEQRSHCLVLKKRTYIRRVVHQDGGGGCYAQLRK